MPRFTVRSTDQSYVSAEIIALEPDGILHIVSQLDCHEADVLQDDRYSFSVRLNPTGMWTIFQRKLQPRAEDIPAFG